MDAAAGLPDAWSQVRAPLIVPLLQLSVAVCLGMAVLLFLERLYMGVVIVGVKLLRRTPERRYKCDPISEEDDPELGSAAFPVVLVQIPMFNEREVSLQAFFPLAFAELHSVHPLLVPPWME
jgi:beta-mannan synthase